MLTAAALLMAATTSDAFSARLWRAMSTDRGNVVVSSTSLNACLGLLIRGVGPESRAPLAKAFGIEVPDLGTYETTLQARLRSLTQGGETTIANAGFFAQPPAPAYASAVAKGFGATAERLLPGPAGVRQVNAWVDGHTKGRIPRLFDRLPERSPAVLLNAVTFDGLWTTPFSPEKTRQAPFASPGGSRSVDTMHVTASFDYAKGAGFQKVSLPYQGGRYRMVILLPDAGDPADLLKDTRWREALAGAGERRVELTLPRFSVQSAPDVESALKAMGLAPLFEKIDFRSAVPSGAVDHIGKVVQKTMIEVGEKGTKAAAATGMAMSRMAIMVQPSIPFHVDRPFAFVLQHVETGEALFQGVIREP